MAYAKKTPTANEIYDSRLRLVDHLRSEISNHRWTLAEEKRPISSCSLDHGSGATAEYFRYHTLPLLAVLINQLMDDPNEIQANRYRRLNIEFLGNGSDDIMSSRVISLPLVDFQGRLRTDVRLSVHSPQETMMSWPQLVECLQGPTGGLMGFNVVIERVYNPDTFEELGNFHNPDAIVDELDLNRRLPEQDVLFMVRKWCEFLDLKQQDFQCSLVQETFDGLPRWVKGLPTGTSIATVEEADSGSLTDSTPDMIEDLLVNRSGLIQAGWKSRDIVVSNVDRSFRDLTGEYTLPADVVEIVNRAIIHGLLSEINLSPADADRVADALHQRIHVYLQNPNEERPHME